MPTYEYKCEVHGEFEYEHGINDTLDQCPMQCNENETWAQPGTNECHLPVKRLLFPVAGKVTGGTPKHYR